MNTAAFLRAHIEQIVYLDDKEFDFVQAFFIPLRVKKKTFLIEAGEVVEAEFLVCKGLLKAFMHDEAFRQHILQFAMEGWWISDYPAYALQSKGQLCVQALEDCEVLALSLKDKAAICTALPKMYQFFGQKAFGGYVALQKRVLSMMKNSAKEKYELLLQSYPELFQRVSKTMIAHYLGVSRETLSRLHKS
ncbi:MAG: Crp/Fnr family transcriptional regulator [Taibaiella sp.]|nr:Crp/Fnr family transcriptional regulator [Taibaiella sp.]